MLASGQLQDITGPTTAVDFGSNSAVVEWMLVIVLRSDIGNVEGEKIR